MPKFKNVKITNFIFCLIAFVLHIISMLIIFLDVGACDWNFLNTLPVANVSPFIFTVVPIYLVLPKSIKKYFFTLISLLSVGMFLATCFNCFYFNSISYKFHPQFVLDYIAHFSISLWGIYLVKSNQIELKVKQCLISGLMIFCVAFIMMLLNVIFDTAFFGLSLNGKHNIYNMVLVENSYLSAFIYLLGLCIVLVIGYFLQKILNKKIKI